MLTNLQVPFLKTMGSPFKEAALGEREGEEL